MASDRILNLPHALGPDRVRARLAAQRYRRFSLARLLRAAPTDSLCGIEGVLVPNWLVRLDVTTGARRRRGRVHETQTRILADGLSGECRALPDSATVSELDTADGFEARVAEQVSAEEAKLYAVQGMRWQVLRSGSIHVRNLRLSAAQAELVYLPAWLGYFTNAGGHIRIRCLNGVDGGVESAVYAMNVLRGLGPTQQPTPDP